MEEEEDRGTVIKPLSPPVASPLWSHEFSKSSSSREGGGKVKTAAAANEFLFDPPLVERKLELGCGFGTPPFRTVSAKHIRARGWWLNCLHIFSELFMFHLGFGWGEIMKQQKKPKVRNTVTFYRVSENGPAPQTGLILEVSR